MKRVLVFVESDFQKQYFADLGNKFEFVFEKLDFSQKLDSYLQNLIAKYTATVPIDGVIGVTDAASLVSCLVADSLGSIAPLPQAICRAQNKAIFSLLAQKINPSNPRTYVLDSEVLPDVTQKCFIRPSRGSLSEYSYIIEGSDQLKEIYTRLKKTRRKVVDWESEVFRKYSRPNDPDVKSFILQKFLDYDQYTVDGFVFKQETTLLGVTKSIYTQDRRSFERFDFPEQLSSKAESTLYNLIYKVIKELGFDNGFFNIEFFVDAHDNIILIEFNTRLSIQFVPLMRQRYSKSNLEIVIDISLGQKPSILAVDKDAKASSIVMRTGTDALVKKVPTAQVINQLKEEGYVLDVQILVDVGRRLSDYKQDSYSFRYCIVDVAGRSLEEILKKYSYAKSKLVFEFNH